MGTEHEVMDTADDKDIFASALSDARDEVTTDVVEEPVETAQASAEEVTAEVETPVHTEPEPERAEAEEAREQHRVPLRELLDTRERAQKAEREREDLARQMQALQARIAAQSRPQVEAPDVLNEPVAYADHILQTVEKRVQERFLNASLSDAHEQHGEKFEKAYQALVSECERGETHLRDKIVNAPNPGRALMAWHAQQETLREVGTDPAAFKARVAAEARDSLMKDPEFRKSLIEELRAEAGTPTTTRPSTVRLPSLNSATPAARNSDAEREPESDRELFRDALGRRR
jgi:uncharacterized tellurite resistance protein B-like protein